MKETILYSCETRPTVKHNVRNVHRGCGPWWRTLSSQLAGREYSTGPVAYTHRRGNSSSRRTRGDQIPVSTSRSRLKEGEAYRFRDSIDVGTHSYLISASRRVQYTASVNRSMALRPFKSDTAQNNNNVQCSTFRRPRSHPDSTSPAPTKPPTRVSTVPLSQGETRGSGQIEWPRIYLPCRGQTMHATSFVRSPFPAFRSVCTVQYCMYVYRNGPARQIRSDPIPEKPFDPMPDASFREISDTWGEVGKRCRCLFREIPRSPSSPRAMANAESRVWNEHCSIHI